MTLRSLYARWTEKEPGRLSFVSNRSNDFVWYENEDLWEKAHEGRRAHALASLRACLGVLAFACLGVAFLDAEKDLQLQRKLSKIKILTGRPG